MPRNIPVQWKIALLIVALILFQLGVLGAVSVNLISNILEEQLGRRALDVSQSIASSPQIIQLIEEKDQHSKLQSIAESIRKKTGAHFIVIGDAQGTRYAHPNSHLIGKKMVGDDNDPALVQGKSYISKAVGTLGPSLRGKVPLINNNAEVVGIVSVGYLEENIQKKIGTHQATILFFTLSLIIMGIISAMLVGRSFRKALLGLSPEEIGHLYSERNAILESIREGIVAINKEGYITLLNQAAVKTLSLNPDRTYLHTHLEAIFPDNGMLDVLNSEKSHLDFVHTVGDKEIIVNRIPIWEKGAVTGVVSSFREKDELEKISRELSQVQSYAQMLRQQTHEYSNKLHTIAGLIQLESYDKAMQLIGSETSGYQDILQFLVAAVSDHIIAGCILGKYNRARELNITLEIDRDSCFSDIPEWMDRKYIVTILGNLLDNAYQAVIILPEKQRTVNLSMTDLGNDLILEVEDAGRGIDQNIASEIYKEGFTTSREKGRGIGLHLVQQALTKLNGYLTLNQSKLGGALFTIYLPKRRCSDE